MQQGVPSCATLSAIPHGHARYLNSPLPGKDGPRLLSFLPLDYIHTGTPTACQLRATMNSKMTNLQATSPPLTKTTMSMKAFSRGLRGAQTRQTVPRRWCLPWTRISTIPSLFAPYSVLQHGAQTLRGVISGCATSLQLPHHVHHSAMYTRQPIQSNAQNSPSCIQSLIQYLLL